MASTETTYTETWSTEIGPYGECKQYEVESYVQEPDPSWGIEHRRLVVTGSIYTIGAGGAVMSNNPYDDPYPETLENDEEVDADRLRDELHLSLSGTSLVGVDSYELPNCEVIHRVEVGD
jgi:hypothetical protein